MKINLGDLVKHARTETTGIVITIFDVPGEVRRLRVRCSDFSTFTVNEDQLELIAFVPSSAGVLPS